MVSELATLAWTVRLFSVVSLSLTIFLTIYGFNNSPSLAIEVKALICWIGVVVIPCPKAALNTSVSYLKLILPLPSLGKQISVLEPKPSFFK